jgi:hypothetical protein
MRDVSPRRAKCGALHWGLKEEDASPYPCSLVRDADFPKFLNASPITFLNVLHPDKVNEVWNADYWIESFIRAIRFALLP